MNNIWFVIWVWVGALILWMIALMILLNTINPILQAIR
jgi:hypothetical protein